MIQLLCSDAFMLNNRQVGLFLALLSAASMWFYVQHLLVPFQRADAAAHLRPRGNLSDLYPRWLGARELLLNHRDPYSPEVTREIQTGYYGRPLDPSRPNDPKDQQAFAYPVYVVFLLAPIIKLPFPVVRSAFGWFLIVLTGLSVLLWLRAMRWRPQVCTIATLLFLTLGCFPAVQGIKLQQLTLLVCGMIAACAVLIAADQLALAGVLLALATIKPQLAFLLTLWLLLWAVSDWRSRKRFFLSFAVTMAVLLTGAQLLLPGWIDRFYHALVAYQQYINGGSVLEVLTTAVIGKVLAGVLVLGLAVVCWGTRRAPGGSPEFTFTTVTVLAVTIVVIPMTAAYNQLLLWPAVYWLAQYGRIFPRKNIASACVSIVCAVAVLWPWLAAAGLSLASLLLPAETVQSHWTLPLFTSQDIPIAVVVMLIPSAIAHLGSPRQVRT